MTEGRSSRRVGLHPVLEVWRRRGSLAVLVFAGLAIPGVAFIHALPNLYRATATVLVDRSQVSDTLVRPAITDELETRLNAMTEEILGRQHLGALIEQFDLYPRLRQSAPTEVVLGRLRRDLHLETRGADRASGRGATIAFDLSYRGRDPVQVAAVANAVAALYVDQNLKAREQQVTRAADFLRGELEEMKGRLMQQEKVIAEYNRRHAGELPQQVEVNLTRLERLNAQLELNGEKQLRAQERGRARPAAGRTAPAGGAVDDATRLQDLEAERSDLLLRCSPSHPDVLRVEAEIEALRSRAPGTRDAGGSPSPGSAGTAPDADASPGAHDLDALRQEESRLRRSIAEVEQSVVGAPERSQEYDTLTRDYHTTRDLYEGLVKRYEEALIASSQEHGQAGERFRVLEPAMPPSLPTGPDRRWLMLMAVLFSAGAAAGSMVLAERLDTSFHDLEALRAFTRVPVLGGIPRLDTRRDRARRLLLRGAAALLAAAVILATAGLGSRIARESDQVVTLLAGDRA